MKKFSLVVLAMALVMVVVVATGCSNKTTDPEPTATPNAIATAIAQATAQATVYNFDEASQVSDWNFDTNSTTLGITAVAHGATAGEGGTGALVATCNMDLSDAAHKQGAIFRTFSSLTSMTGRTIRVRVYIPAALISTDPLTPAQIAIYVQGNNTADWNGWTDNSFNIDPSMADTWQTFTWTPTASWIATSWRVGIQVRVGTNTATGYTGTIAFENITF